MDLIVTFPTSSTLKLRLHEKNQNDWDLGVLTIQSISLIFMIYPADRTQYQPED